MKRYGNEFLKTAAIINLNVYCVMINFIATSL